MSKIYMTGDTHFGVHKLDLNKWINIQFDYFFKDFIPYLKANVKEGDILIHGGDLFDDRSSVPIIVQNKVEDLLLELGKILPVHILIGNHDCWSKGNNDVNSPRLFRHLPNINIYESTHILEKDGKKLVLMPWIETKPEMLKKIDENPGDYLFCHSDLNGCRMHLSSVAHRNKDKINVEAFQKYIRVFSSHIHIRQVNANFEFIGSPYQMDRNDYNDQKGITILDLETGERLFIDNKTSPTFKKVNVEKEDDLALLEFIDTKKHFVDLIISNSVLVGKRKNRKFLEKVLSNKKFSSVEYNNDLSKKKEDIKLLNEKVTLDDSKVNDFKSLILDYTSQLEFGSDKIGEGTTKELNMILEIYDKHYKFKIDE